MLSRQQVANIYRPVGPKPVQLGINATPGQTPTVLNFDLSLPLEGLRLIYSGRIAVATANYTSVVPEGILNLLSDIKISGTNTRQGGNVTLFDVDLATIFGIRSLFQYRPDQFNIGGTVRSVPSTPFPTGYFLGTTAGSPYDFRVVVDLPFFPFHAPVTQRPGFLVRQNEWRDSLQLQMTFPAVPDNATNPLGVSAATTVTTFSAIGGATGNPTIDVYSLPIIMGDTANAVLPGFCTRTQQPLTSILQSSGNAVTLLQLQKMATSRIFLKTGVSTLAPSFSSLSDTNVTALGMSLGGNRFVRNLVDVFSHKADQTGLTGRDAIQGYTMFNFLQSGNSRSAYQADLAGSGTTLQLTANVVGVANAYGIVVQEQLLYQPEGFLYSM
jgi:hypothetical protein